MTAEQILKIISDNYKYFQYKRDGATCEEERFVYTCAMMGIDNINIDILKESIKNEQSILGLQKTE